MLSQEERDLLQSFIDRSQPGTAYLRRARILLLADDGLAAESIAAEANIPVNRVRQLLRVFRQEHLSIFPDSLLSAPRSYSPDDPIAEAGRRVMATLVEKVRSHEPDLRRETDVFSVHETRKTCRRLRTAFRVFGPFYEPGLLNGYRRRFRKFMRRLGRSRDIAVFLIKLDHFMSEGRDLGHLSDVARKSLALFEGFWRDSQATADERVRDYLAQNTHQQLLSEFGEFTDSAGHGVRVSDDSVTPSRVRHIAPYLIYEKVAAVRAYEWYVDSASLETLHALRIRCKELRYTLEFFEPVLGPSAADTLTILKRILTHLGDLNDARIALGMIKEMNDESMAPAVELFSRQKMAELEELTTSFPRAFSEISQPAWNRALAESIGFL